MEDVSSGTERVFNEAVIVRIGFSAYVNIGIP
jgi:hypothetical protein